MTNKKIELANDCLVLRDHIKAGHCDAAIEVINYILAEVKALKNIGMEGASACTEYLMDDAELYVVESDIKESDDE